MWRLRSWALVLVILALVSCGGAMTPTTGQSVSPTPTARDVVTPAPSAAAATPAGVATPGRGASPVRPAGPPKKLTIGLGYIPDIQFAPFYVAKERGYFLDEGLDVDFQQGFETDVLKLVGTNALAVGVAGGDEVLIARSQGVPLVYLASWFQKYPITVVALASANIHTVADLKGRTIGIPGRFGATYVGLRALLDSAGMTESDVQLREIGFNQVQALTQRQVEAVVGYANNEPVQLQALGQAITTLNVYDAVNLVANGLLTSEKTLQEQPELLRAVTRAMLRGIAEVIARPEEAIASCIAYIPGSADKVPQLRAVLLASIPLWQSEQTRQHGLGYSDPAAWAATRDLLKKLGFLGATPFDLARVYSNDFLPSR